MTFHGEAIPVVVPSTAEEGMTQCDRSKTTYGYGGWWSRVIGRGWSVCAGRVRRLQRVPVAGPTVRVLGRGEQGDRASLPDGRGRCARRRGRLPGDVPRGSAGLPTGPRARQARSVDPGDREPEGDRPPPRSSEAAGADGRSA